MRFSLLILILESRCNLYTAYSFQYEKVYTKKSKCWNGLKRKGCGNIESFSHEQPYYYFPSSRQGEQIYQNRKVPQFIEDPKFVSEGIPFFPFQLSHFHSLDLAQISSFGPGKASECQPFPRDWVKCFTQFTTLKIHNTVKNYYYPQLTDEETKALKSWWFTQPTNEGVETGVQVGLTGKPVLFPAHNVLSFEFLTLWSYQGFLGLS